MTQGTIWILGMLRLTIWAQDSFFYFLGSGLLATIRNNEWMDIREFSGYEHKEQLFKLCYDWLDVEICALKVLLVYIWICNENG